MPVRVVLLHGLYCSTKRARKIMRVVVVSFSDMRGAAKRRYRIVVSQNGSRDNGFAAHDSCRAPLSAPGGFAEGFEMNSQKIFVLIAIISSSVIIAFVAMNAIGLTVSLTGLVAAMWLNGFWARREDEEEHGASRPKKREGESDS